MKVFESIQARSQYNSIHRWIRKNYGSANKCENIHCKGECERFEWALKKGYEYQRDVNNFTQLCSSCHIKYDYTEERKLKLIKSKFNMPRTDSKVIMKYDKKGNLEGSYLTMSIAARENNILVTSIANCLSGRSKTCNNHIWKSKTELCAH